MNKRGFTIVELLIVISIMGILLTLSVVNMRSSQANARDSERKADIESIAKSLEAYYTSGTDNSATYGSYPSTALTSSGADYMLQILRDISPESLKAPGINDASQTFISATNAIQTIGGVLPQPGINQYVYQPIKNDGTLCAPSTNSVQVLVVGGGGGGGAAGGGGGGGVASGNISPISGSISVTIGTGGNGGNGSTQGGNGGDSVFSTITAYGGGGGGKSDSSGSDGASGGGGGTNTNIGQNVYGGLHNHGSQGYDGGTTPGLGCSPSGGGGGAGSTGGNATSVAGGSGGNGLSSDITGKNVYYGGGGGGGGYCVGGGAGGFGGGGGGAHWTIGTPGTNNTGGGGGGGSNGGNGGSGVVIIKYLTGSMTATGGNITYSGGYTIHTFKSNGTFTVLASDSECRKFNLYYRSETDNTVRMITSKNQ